MASLPPHFPVLLPASAAAFSSAIFSMKVTLTKEQAIGEYADLEEIHHPEVYGVLKRPEDPPIKSLLAWDPVESSPKQTKGVRTSHKWMTEMRDSYRGFFFSEDKKKLYRLREEDTPSFDPSSLAENSKERTLTSLKVTARDIPKEESGLIGSSFNDQQPQSKAPVLAASAGDDPASRPSEPLPKPDLIPLAPKPATAKPTKRQSAPERAKSATPQGDDPERRKRQEERIKKLHQTTRWLPNSAFTTYYGKPPFCAYGQANVNPTVGGIMYGNYLATHNVAAQEGANSPMYQQVYGTAELYASKRPPKSPEPPRKCKDEDRFTPDQVNELKARSQITGKLRTKPSKPIHKPDLLKAKTFQSVHSTPNLSRVEEGEQAATARNSEQPAASGKGKPDLHLKTTPKPQAKAETARPEQVVHLPEEPQIEVPKQPAEKQQSESAPQTQDECVQIDAVRSPPSGSASQRAQPTPSLIPLSPAPRLDPHPPAEVPAEDCEKCFEDHMRTLQYQTAYKEMTGKVPYNAEVPVAEPFRYCKGCLAKLCPERGDLAPEDMLKPPRNLGEIPVQELNPRTYKYVPAKWTQRIPAAGKLTYRSPSSYQVIFYDPLYT